LDSGTSVWIEWRRAKIKVLMATLGRVTLRVSARGAKADKAL
jgi:hypothetical protein